MFKLLLTANEVKFSHGFPHLTVSFLLHPVGFKTLANSANSNGS